MFVNVESKFVRQSLAMLPVFINMFFFGCHQTWLSNVAFYLVQPDNVPSATLSQCGYIGSSLELGKLLFAAPGVMLVDSIGRKKVVVVVGCVNTLTWTALVFSNTLTQIYIIRFISGVSIVLCVSTYVALVDELSSPEYRGIFATVVVVPLWSSSIFQSVVSVAFSSYRAVAVGAAASTLLFYPCTYFLLESPHFLIGAGHYRLAKRNLTHLQPDRTSPEIDAQLDALRTAAVGVDKSADGEAERSTTAIVHPLFRALTSRGLLAAGLVRALHTFCGPLFLSAFMTVVLPPNRWLPKAAYPLAAGVAALASQFAGAFAIERLEAGWRRPLLAAGCAACALTLCVEGGAYYGRLYELHETWRWVTVTGLVAVVCLHAALVSPLAEALACDLFPFRVKSVAGGLWLTFRSAVSVAGFVAFDVVSQWAGVYANFAVYAVATVWLAVVAQCCGRRRVTSESSEETRS